MKAVQRHIEDSTQQLPDDPDTWQNAAAKGPRWHSHVH